MGSPDPDPRGQDSLPGSEPATFPDVLPTGDTAVDEVLQALASVPELDEAAQHSAYERLHDGLLAELNTEHS